MTTKTKVVYADTVDGRFSAWLLYRYRFGKDAEYLPIVDVAQPRFNMPILAIEGAVVFIVGFIPPKDALGKIREHATSLIVFNIGEVVRTKDDPMAWLYGRKDRPCCLQVVEFLKTTGRYTENPTWERLMWVVMAETIGGIHRTCSAEIVAALGSWPGLPEEWDNRMRKANFGALIVEGAAILARPLAKKESATTDDAENAGDVASEPTEAASEPGVDVTPDDAGEPQKADDKPPKRGRGSGGRFRGKGNK